MFVSVTDIYIRLALAEYSNEHQSVRCRDDQMRRVTLTG